MQKGLSGRHLGEGKLWLKEEMVAGRKSQRSVGCRSRIRGGDGVRWGVVLHLGREIVDPDRPLGSRAKGLGEQVQGLVCGRRVVRSPGLCVTI